mmetsp:Transcript_41217/g.73857  ORF Transcript_41217/g.73857 Transcript_41217/m.73857 type:complete len:297 (-) Transcript_41217:150-1040(-)
MYRVWPDRNLQQDLESIFPFLDGWLGWFEPWSAWWIYQFVTAGLSISTAAYFISLVLGMVCNCFGCPSRGTAAYMTLEDGEVTKPNKPSGKLLLETGFAQLREEFPELPLQEEREVDMDPCKFFSSLFGKMLLMGLDVLFDINTIFSLLLSRDYLFALTLTFVASRSTLKQLQNQNLEQLQAAYNKSVEKKIQHRILIEVFEEEKGCEAFFSLCITSYSYVFCVQTALQAIVQAFSLLLSVHSLATFLVEKLDLEVEEDEEHERGDSTDVETSEIAGSQASSNTFDGELGCSKACI